MFSLRRYVRRPSPPMVVALIALFVASSGVAYATIPDSGGVIHGCYSDRTGALRVIDNEAAEACNATKETPLSWSQQGIAGAPGAAGSDAASALTGRIDAANTLGGLSWAYPEGHSAAVDDQEVDTFFLSPNATIVAQDLSVQLTVSPTLFGGAPQSRTFTLRDDGVDTSVSCTITGAEFTCNSGGNTATIAPGSKLSLQLFETCFGFLTQVCPRPTAVMFGWRATTP